MKNYLLIFVLFLTNSCLLVSHAQSVQFFPEGDGETFRNLISAKSHLLLGSSNAIYRLDNSLVRQEKKSLGDANRMLVTDYVGSYRDSVLSCSNVSCFLAQVTDFTNITWQVTPPFIRKLGVDNVAAVFAPRANGTSDLTYGERAGLNTGSRLLIKGSLANVGAANVTQSFYGYARREEGNRFDPLVYLTEFPLRYMANDSGYIYFVVRPNEGETRVVRFCEDDPGILGIFASHFEIVLQCGSHGDRAPSTAATFINVNTTAFNDRPTIIVSTNRVLGMNNMQLEVCAFDIGYINFLMTRKYEDCINARNNALGGFARDGEQETCTVVDPSLVSECFLPGRARPGLEVTNPLVQEPIITLPVTTVTTSMIHTTLDGVLFLFATTTNGSLLQFHISNPTTANHVRTVQLPLDSLENITRMVASDNGEYIFAMTPSRLFRHSVDMCNNFTSCSECLTSGDPICGWCPLSGTCTRQSNCPSVAPVATPIWINQEISCPAIETISPEIVYIPDLSSTITFTITTSNIASTPLSMYDYYCQFRFQNANGNTMIADRMATQSNGVFTCTAPPGNQIPQLAEGQDTLETMISLTVRGQRDVSIAALDMFPFTDCAVHDSCTSCIGASRCEWCPFSFQCIQPGRTCTSQESPVVNGGVCPQIFPSSSTGEYLIHANYDYQPETPLRINSSDLTLFVDDFNTNRFTCQICSQNDSSCSSPLFTSPASLAPSRNEVLCEKTRFDSNDPTPAITARLRVVWNGQRTIDNPDNASVILYSCSLMGTNCGQCLAQESRFECSYCVEGPAPPSAPGSCQLGATCSTGNGFLRFEDPQDVQNCPMPVISDFEPKRGPTRGGTTVTIHGSNLGARRQDIITVMIDGVPCNVTGYTPGILITCITGEKEGSIISDTVSINFAHRSDVVESVESFTFVTPFLAESPATPNMGPRSGGTNITIMGTDIGSGSTHRVTVGGKDCKITEVKRDSIKCTTPPGDAVTGAETQELVEVFVDNWSLQLAGFQYVVDPIFESITPNFTFIAGGINYTITGRNLNSVQEPRLLVYYDDAPITSGNRRRRQVMQEGRLQSEPCVVESPLRMHCTAPSLSNSMEFNQSSRPLQIGLLMDGVSSLLELNTSLSLHPDPVFNQFTEVMVFTSGDPIQLIIQGERFVFSADQVNVFIEPCNSDQSCLCTVSNVFSMNNSLTCEIDILTQRDLQRSQPLMISTVIGNINQEIGTIQIVDDSQLDILFYLIPVFAVIIIFIGVILMVIVAIFCRKARQKDRKYDQLILELEKLESSVARECKLGFAELQTDLDELTGDVVGCRLPYRDLQSYLLTTLFPGAKSHSHPVLQPLQIPNHQRPLVERGLKDFGNLLLDKRTLLIFIRSMEEQRGFTIRDKSIVGSLLIVALHNRLDYATEVLRSLLSELIRKTVQTSYPKLLLRRTESVAEKMLTNWLAFCLHGYVMEHVGQPMYLLYRAVKNQLEKGPIDVITGEARYSLSEQKLIRQKVEVVVLDATVEMEDGLRIPVKLLDCDTISQAKEKMLDAVYKAAPVSQRPSLTKVDLEYVKSSNERAILRDEDSSTVVEGGWKKINTLKHYWVKEGAIFRLIPRREYAPPGRAYDYPGSLISSHTPRQRALSEAEDGSRVWHLFKQLDMEDPKRSPFMNKKLVSEIYLPRMLSTKSILQKFADDLFRSLFSTSHPPSSPTATYMAVFPNSPGVQVPMGYAPGADAVPMAVKYLFDFLDDEAEATKILDPDVVHTWKNNAISLRFWVNLIKNPEFVFDINKSHTVDACLSVIAQAFIDGCSSSEMKLTIDSPTSKLLYNKEVQGYKAQVKKYYDNIRNLPRIPEDAMQYYLRQLSTYQSQQMRKAGGAGFVVESALQELLRYAQKYHEPFLQNLRAAGLESKAQMFEGVLKVSSN